MLKQKLILFIATILFCSFICINSVKKTEGEALSGSGLLLASYLGDLNEVKRLASEGASLNRANKEGDTPLILAIGQGKKDIAKYLIKHLANVNQANTLGFTPLHYAALKGEREMICRLLASGAAIDKQSTMGWSALHVAAAYGKEECIFELAKRGAKINEKDCFGKSPLLVAIQQKEIGAVKQLIDLGADVNVSDHLGNSALLTAAKIGDVEIGKILIEAKVEMAPLEVESQKGKTSTLYFVRMQRNKNHKPFAKLLKENSPYLKELEKEHIHIKRLGHAWKMEGSCKVFPKSKEYPELTLKLLGGRSSLFYRTMARGTKNYLDTYPKGVKASLFKEEELARLQSMLDLGGELYEIAPRELLETILQKKPTPLHIGWQKEKHQVEILIWNNTLVFCNRGVGSRKPLEYFSFDVSSLSKETLKKILSLDGTNKENFEKSFFGDIAKELKLEKRAFHRFVEENSNLPLQTVDNCAWENTEGAAFACLLLEGLAPYSCLEEKELANSLEKMQLQIAAQEKKFAQWLRFQQLDIFERYLIHHNEGKTPYKSNKKLIEKVIKSILQDPLFLSDEILCLKIHKIESEIKKASLPANQS